MCAFPKAKSYYTFECLHQYFVYQESQSNRKGFQQFSLETELIEPKRWSRINYAVSTARLQDLGYIIVVHFRLEHAYLFALAVCLSRKILFSVNDESGQHSRHSGEQSSLSSSRPLICTGNSYILGLTWNVYRRIWKLELSICTV